MKKILFSFLLLFVFVSGMAVASSLNGTYNGNPIVLVKSGDKVLTDEVPAQIIDGKTMVPLTMIRNLGFNVTWNADDYSVQVKQKHDLTEAEVTQISRNVGIIYVYKNSAYLGQGSGFVINTSSYGKVMVTNCHIGCIGNDLKITIDGEQHDFNGTPLFANEATDVYGFVIKTNVPGLNYESEFPAVNDSVKAIGFPSGKYEVSSGSVTYIDRIGTKYIQFNSEVKPGSSGGLLTNSDGKAIGITTKGSPNNGVIISQAMPMQYVQDELNKLR